MIERVISTSAASAQIKALGFEARTVTCSQLSGANSRATLATEYARASSVRNSDCETLYTIELTEDRWLKT